MREILFRGKAANREDYRVYRTKYKNGDWVFGLLTDTDNYLGFAEMTNTGGVQGIEVDKDTIGQFTGLTDKNGKKIFEGDIIYMGLFPFVVKYDLENARYMLFFGDAKRDGFNVYTMETHEVVGNIHDNPELVKGG